MIISLAWLREFVDLPETPDELSRTLTMAGLEVEAVELWERVPGSLQGVVVAEVKECTRHPDADRLSLCQVDAAQPEGLLQVVCGAPNVVAGQKVLLALPGTTLHPFGGGEPITLKKSKIRGQESNGMICAEDELGLGASHDGILVLLPETPVGQPAAQYFGFSSDTVFHIGLTPNRTDAMSHWGVARDLAAVLNRPLRREVLSSTYPVADSQSFTVQVVNPERCQRYAGVVIRNVKVQPSPQWLQDKLLSLGLRPINNVVDATNYVLHGFGQPLHAFDLSKITGDKIIVRTAQPTEQLTLLDGRTITLHPEDLVIADTEKALCLAGVMGGIDSGVSETTTDIFLESAYFTPESIRASAKRYGLHTDASFRFERGIDPNSLLWAQNVAVNLILETAGGTASECFEQSAQVFPPTAVQFAPQKIEELIGEQLGEQTIVEILSRLEIRVDKQDSNLFIAYVPPFRTDVTRTADLAEEVLRVYGFNNIQASEKLHASPSIDTDETGYRLRERVANALSTMGLHEAMNSSLVPGSTSQPGAVHMLNPSSESHSALRTSLLPSLLQNVAHNQKRQQSDVRLFEFGRTYFTTDTGFSERHQLAIIITGFTEPDGWQQKSKHSSLFTLRSYIERLFQLLGQNPLFDVLENSDEELAYGLSLCIHKKLVGLLGKVKPSITRNEDVKADVYYALLEWDILLKMRHTKLPEYKPVPRFPFVERDFSFELLQAIPYNDIERAVFTVNPKRVKRVRLFDVYETPEGLRSYTVNVQFQDNEKTLEDQEVDKISAKIVDTLERDGRLKLRR